MKRQQLNTYILLLLNSSKKAKAFHLEQFPMVDLKILSKSNYSLASKCPCPNSSLTS